VGRGLGGEAGAGATARARPARRPRGACFAAAAPVRSCRPAWCPALLPHLPSAHLGVAQQEGAQEGDVGLACGAPRSIAPPRPPVPPAAPRPPPWCLPAGRRTGRRRWSCPRRPPGQRAPRGRGGCPGGGGGGGAGGRKARGACSEGGVGQGRARWQLPRRAATPAGGRPAGAPRRAAQPPPAPRAAAAGRSGRRRAEGTSPRRPAGRATSRARPAAATWGLRDWEGAAGRRGAERAQPRQPRALEPSTAAGEAAEDATAWAPKLTAPKPRGRPGSRHNPPPPPQAPSTHPCPASQQSPGRCPCRPAGWRGQTFRGVGGWGSGRVGGWELRRRWS
jgi:hypothetical protein